MRTISCSRFFVAYGVFLSGFFLLPCVQPSICRAAQPSDAAPSPAPPSLREADSISPDEIPDGVSIRQGARTRLFSGNGEQLVIGESLWATAKTPRERAGLIAFARAYLDFEDEGRAEVSQTDEEETSDANLIREPVGEKGDGKMIRRRRDQRWQLGPDLTERSARERESSEIQHRFSPDGDAFQPVRPGIPVADMRARAQNALRAAALAGLSEQRMTAMLRQTAAQGRDGASSAVAVPSTQSQIDAQRIIRELGMFAF